MGHAKATLVHCTLLLVACQGLTVACQGELNADSPRRPGAGTFVVQRSDGSFVCEADARPSVTDLRRLSAVQYENTLESLFEGVAGVDVRGVARSALMGLPADGAADVRYARMDARLSARHVQSYYEVADVVAQAVEASAEAQASLLGACASEATLTPECIDGFLDDFAARVLRRPVESEERSRLHALNDGTRTGPEVVRGLVFSLLLAPSFLFKVEVMGAPIEGDIHFELDGYALASRLSYHFWQSMPDQELFDAAADGSILTEAGYAAQVERVVADPRTESAIQGFYREWLHYDQVGGFPDSAVFSAFAQGAGLENADSDPLAAMHEEIDALTRYYTWEVDGDVRDMLTSNISFTQSTFLADLYGVPVWDGVSERPRFDPAERSGILTRAAFLITGQHVTNPVFRGALIRRHVLCQDLQPPDPASLPAGSLDTPEFRPDMTTRERYETKTAEEPCASCHRQLNPIGFTLERYDALGRWRDQEQVLDELTGEVIAELPINTAVAPYITPRDTAQVSEPSELMERVADSGLVEACFARNYFRFTHGREETSSDGCALEAVRNALSRASDAPGSLREALRAIALDPSFRERVVGPANGRP